MTIEKIQLRDKKGRFEVGRIPWNKGIFWKGKRCGEEHPNFGNIWSEDAKLRMSKKIKGMFALEKHPNWLNGKSFEPYSKEFNNKFKRAIRKRDNQICMLYVVHREKMNRSLDVHHINYDKLLSIPENCVSLCPSCHGKTHYNRSQWITFFQSLLTIKYNYQYSNKQEVIINIK